MKHTKTILAIATVFAILFSCSKNDDNTVNDVPSFVRFNFLTNSNNEPLEYPQISSAIIPSINYINTSINTLKVPVTLTSYTLENEVTVNYSVTSSSNEDLFTISPLNQVSFQNNQLTDTIYINFGKRWSSNESIVLNIESVSDSSINLGNLNSNETNTEFTINLEPITTTYTFLENRIEITGTPGEEIDFAVNFPNGYIPSEIENLDIFSFLDGFDYTLTTLNLGENKTSITYRLTLNEAINNDDVLYQTIITLNDTDNYNATGNKNLQIVKPIKTARDNSVNIAANFYNLSDSFYRTYLEHWSDFNEDGICVWQSTFAFTYPIVVDATNPNAVLYDDKGTTDTSDDIYHHAFQIGFDSPISSTTTNSFNLKRYFTNEGTDRVNSPGFNVTPAIEFFPENGTSTTNGSILIIPQFLTISGTNGNSYAFAISGEGTYQEIGDGIFELKFKLNLTNEEVFGGTITSEYRLYNTANYTVPEDLTTNNCVTEYTL
ncbi:hypothetical protein H0I29_04535 [Polaribacter sp. R2A056_3_33]|uniref:hypothetical protein n=1 Tax=Polaribacter sp. R2A056_3_33 TaxID=2745563 RepID=UPI001C4E531A|nr:hypothetical protein [Polaribacter sp. R2A056_3_33]QXP71356.1 hypothetical protein H0I29_04535 [Polaribacter sp. R2A056_3_33]